MANVNLFSSTVPSVEAPRQPSSRCKQIFGNRFLHLTLCVAGILALWMGYHYLQSIGRIVTMSAGGLSFALFIIAYVCGTKPDWQPHLDKTHAQAQQSSTATTTTRQRIIDDDAQKSSSSTIPPTVKSPLLTRQRITDDQPLVDLLKEAGIKDAETREFPYIYTGDLKLGFRIGYLDHIEILSKMEHVPKDEISIIKTESSRYKLLYFPKLQMLLTSGRFHEGGAFFDYQLPATMLPFQAIATSIQPDKKEKLINLIKLESSSQGTEIRERVKQLCQ